MCMGGTEQHVGTGGICPGSALPHHQSWVCVITVMLSSWLPVLVPVPFSLSSGASGTWRSYALRLCPLTIKARPRVPTGPVHAE